MEMTENYLKFLVKEYKHWAIYVHENQGYLGRCVVWCKRENALDLADATPEEQAELFLVLRDLRKEAKQVFQPDWFNYSFLGNETRHLHGHFIPRYAKPKTLDLLRVGFFVPFSRLACPAPNLTSLSQLPGRVTNFYPTLAEG